MNLENYKRKNVVRRAGHIMHACHYSEIKTREIILIEISTPLKMSSRSRQSK